MKISNSYLQNVRSFWTEGFKNPCFRNQQKHFKDHSPELLQCVPYFFVIGFPKCGTTDLFDRLSHHPEFLKPAFKEIHWISRYRFIPPRTNRLKFIAMNRTYRKWKKPFISMLIIILAISYEILKEKSCLFNEVFLLQFVIIIHCIIRLWIVLNAWDIYPFSIFSPFTLINLVHVFSCF